MARLAKISRLTSNNLTPWDTELYCIRYSWMTKTCPMQELPCHVCTPTNEAYVDFHAVFDSLSHPALDWAFWQRLSHNLRHYMSIQSPEPMRIKILSQIAFQLSLECINTRILPHDWYVLSHILQEFSDYVQCTVTTTLLLLLLLLLLRICALSWITCRVCGLTSGHLCLVLWPAPHYFISY